MNPSAALVLLREEQAREERASMEELHRLRGEGSDADGESDDQKALRELLVAADLEQYHKPDRQRNDCEGKSQR